MTKLYQRTQEKQSPFFPEQRLRLELSLRVILTTGRYRVPTDSRQPPLPRPPIQLALQPALRYLGRGSFYFTGFYSVEVHHEFERHSH